MTLILAHTMTFKKRLRTVSGKAYIPHWNFVTTEPSHLDDLLFDDPSIMIEWDNTNRQPIWKEILLDGGILDSEGETYYPYDCNPQNEGENKD